MREEPRENRIAMPWQLLLAAITTALVWGWPRVAGILALSWGGLLRIGEAFSAKRSDLLLPGDVKDTCDYALLSVGEPKTRYKAARHQSAKIDQPDLVRVISLVFGPLGFTHKLWPQSSSTFRSRFDMITQRLDAAVLPFHKARKLDLGTMADRAQAFPPFSPDIPQRLVVQSCYGPNKSSAATRPQLMKNMYELSSSNPYIIG